MTAALVAIFCLILGIVCGLLFGRATNAPYQEAQELKDALKSAQYELETYKSDVTHHFTKTAELVNEMTDNYRTVHSHLATGAQTLTAGSLQLESMNDKEALEAQAEVVADAEPETVAEETAASADNAEEQTASSADQGAEAEAADATAENEVAKEADTGSDATGEPIEVAADTVNGEAAEAAEAATTTTTEEPSAELVAEAATAEQKPEDARVH